RHHGEAYGHTRPRHHGEVYGRTYLHRHASAYGRTRSHHHGEAYGHTRPHHHGEAYDRTADRHHGAGYFPCGASPLWDVAAYRLRLARVVARSSQLQHTKRAAWGEGSIDDLLL